MDRQPEGRKEERIRGDFQVPEEGGWEVVGIAGSLENVEAEIPLRARARGWGE